MVFDDKTAAARSAVPRVGHRAQRAGLAGGRLPDEINHRVENEVRQQLTDMLSLDDDSEPNFGDADYQLAAYAAALRVLTEKPIEDIDPQKEINRVRGAYGRQDRRRRGGAELAQDRAARLLGPPHQSDRPAGLPGPARPSHRNGPLASRRRVRPPARWRPAQRPRVN